MTYDNFIDACNFGSACPCCFTTCAWFIRKVKDPAQKAFHCEACGYRFAGHEFVDHAKVAA